MPRDKKGNIVSWEEYAQKALIGRKIVSVRWMTDQEIDQIGWNKKAVVIQLDDETVIYPSRDDEGNDAGALFGNDPDGEDLTFPVI